MLDSAGERQVVSRASSRTPPAPFGGWKHSGLGREVGHVGIEEFLETKYVALATTT